MTYKTIRFLLFLSALLALNFSSAQSFDDFQKKMNAEFDKFDSDTQKEYDNFCREINARYAEFMKLAWTEIEPEPIIPAPKPNPPVQPVYDPEQGIKSQIEMPVTRNLMLVKKIVKKIFPFRPIPEDKAAEKPAKDAKKQTKKEQVAQEVAENVENIETAEAAEVAETTEAAETAETAEVAEAEAAKAEAELPALTLDVDFYGAVCTLRANKDAIRFEMPDYNEFNVSNYWARLADGRVNPLINDCLAVREKLQLCDWGYWQLVQCVANTIYDKENDRESIVLQAYIMTQSGYKVRLARNTTGLMILISSDSQIYETSYFHINGARFYAIGKRVDTAYICDFEFPGESTFAIQMSSLPDLPIDSITGRELHAERLGEKTITLKHNRNMINYLDSYPQCSIDNYTHTSIDSLTKQTLYPALKEVIEGKTEEEAANILINFVQTAFDYKVDNDQFGCERTLFANETLYYPYSDCEDRALLFATLVRDLMGLNVVLLDYPLHFATAVEFTEPIEGAYFLIEGKRYTICDPTFINADIGNCMPEFREVAAQIVKISD